MSSPLCRCPGRLSPKSPVMVAPFTGLTRRFEPQELGGGAGAGAGAGVVSTAGWVVEASGERTSAFVVWGAAGSGAGSLFGTVCTTIFATGPRPPIAGRTWADSALDARWILKP